MLNFNIHFLRFIFTILTIAVTAPLVAEDSVDRSPKSESKPIPLGKPTNPRETIKTQIDKLEPTDKVAIRYIRVPKSDTEDAKLIRMEVPIFRWKLGQEPKSIRSND